MLRKASYCSKMLMLAVLLFFVGPGFIGFSEPVQAAEPKDDAILQNYRSGEVLPPFDLPLIEGGPSEKFTPGQGKPTILIFFSIRPNFRKKRSLALLAALSDLADKYKQQIKIAGIYCDDTQHQTVVNYMKASAPHIMVYADPLKKVLDRYGVFMMPLVIMTTEKGKLHAVIPYTYNILELVGGNIKLLLGEWTEKQLHESLRPKKLVARSETEKEYIRRLNYGRIMKDRKMYPQAIREFSVAVKIMPKAIAAYLDLGFAELAEKQWGKAEATFKKAQTIDKDSDDAIAGLGLAYYGKGDKKAAKPALENAFIAPHPRLEVIVALAAIYEGDGNDRKANRLNKLAISRLMNMYKRHWESESN